MKKKRISRKKTDSHEYIEERIESAMREMEIKLKSLTETGLEAWEDIKDIASRTWIELYDAADKARHNLRLRNY